MSHPTPGLERVLRRRHVLALAFGAMIGWSWVVLAGDWIVRGGTLGAILAFVGGGVAVIVIGLTYAELAAAMPVVGGEHAYSLRALGPTASFVCTWAIVLGYVSVVAFEAVALPTALEYLAPGFSRGHLWTVAGWEVEATWVLVGVAGAVLMTWINIRGVGLAARLQTAVTAVIVAVGIAFLAGAFSQGAVANLEPLWVGGAAGTLGVLVMVPFMFVGFDVIPQAAEEIDLPFNAIGKLLVLSIAMAVAWYGLIILGVALALPDAELHASPLVTADAATAVWGTRWAGTLLVAGGIAGILTSWNSFLVGASRAIYALAHSSMLPAFFGRLHPRYRTPANATLFVGALSVLAPLFGRPALVWLVNAGGLGIVVAYGFVSLSFLVLRRREPELERPFRVRGGLWVGGLALVLSVGLALLYLPGSPAALRWPQEWGIVLGWTVAGAVLYLLSRRAAGAAT